MDNTYQKKEDARMGLENALVEYKDAAEKYGMSMDDMAVEIDDLLSDAGLEELTILFSN